MKIIKTRLCLYSRSAAVGLLLAVPCVAIAQAQAPGGGVSGGASSKGGVSAQGGAAVKGSGAAQTGGSAKVGGAATGSSPANGGSGVNGGGTANGNGNTPANGGTNAGVGQNRGTGQPQAIGQNGNNTQQPGTNRSPNTIQQSGASPQGTTPGNMANMQGGVGGTFSAGAIGGFSEAGFSFLTSPDGVATNYQFGPATTFTDSEGRNIPREKFNSQMPATVYYVRSGDALVATRVVAKATPTPVSAGTVKEVSDGVFVIEVPGASTTPVRYVNNKTTNYVDQNGEAVPPEMIKAGTPVKVFYTKVGDTLVATKIEVVRRDEAPGLPKPPIAEDPGKDSTKPETKP